MIRISCVVLMLLMTPWFGLMTKLQAQSTNPVVVSGTLVRIDDFHSKFIPGRTIDIWLPAGYSDSIKYSVLYMHDGQMLFDPQQTWNKQAWDIDDVASDLFANHSIEPFIVVGIWNSGVLRHAEYFPQKPVEYMTAEEHDTLSAQLQHAGRVKGSFEPCSDGYLQFLVRELKPYIDQHFSVHTDRSHTYIGGSSMGGLISLYALCEYPRVFGGAACMSTHWVGSFALDNNPFPKAMMHYLEMRLPNHRKHKIYFDCGDQTLDALYPDIQRQVDSIMVQHGYNEKSWLTIYEPGSDHSEQSWKRRLPAAFMFLFGH